MLPVVRSRRIPFQRAGRFDRNERVAAKRLFCKEFERRRLIESVANLQSRQLDFDARSARLVKRQFDDGNQNLLERRPAARFRARFLSAQRRQTTRAAIAGYHDPPQSPRSQFSSGAFDQIADDLQLVGQIKRRRGRANARIVVDNPVALDRVQPSFQKFFAFSFVATRFI